MVPRDALVFAGRAGPGERLKIRIYGEKAGLEWVQADPPICGIHNWVNRVSYHTRLGRGRGRCGPRHAHSVRPSGRLPWAFATIYSEAAEAILAHRAGKKVAAEVNYPGIAEGMAGMKFVDACLRSSKRNGAWVTL